MNIYKTLVSRWFDDDDVAIVDGNIIHTYHQLARESLVLAKWLKSEGFKSGDRFGIWMPNAAAWLAMYLACSSIGVIVVSLNSRFLSEELSDIVERSGCRGLLFWPDYQNRAYLDILRNCSLKSVSQLKIIIEYGAVVKDTISLIENIPTHSYKEIIDNGCAVTPLLDHAAGDSIVFTTSGSTRLPKLVLHDQRRVLHHAFSVAQHFGLNAESTVLIGLPLCGVFGFCSALAALCSHGKIVMMASWRAQQALELLAQHRVTHFNATDDMINQLLANQSDTKWQASITFVGFAGFNPEHSNIVEKCERQGLKLVGLYGSTEVQGLFARQREDDGSMSRSAAGGWMVDSAAKVRVRDPESGDLVTGKTLGELEFHAPNSIMSGYMGDDAAYCRAVDEEGWFRSGDLGYKIDDRRFVYIARFGDSFRIHGFLVSALEIEAVIKQLDWVQACQVVDVAFDGKRQLVAFVKMNDDAVFDLSGIISHASRHLAHYKVPSHVFALDTFPTIEGSNGTKINKQALKSMAFRLSVDQRNAQMTSGCDLRDKQ